MNDAFSPEQFVEVEGNSAPAGLSGGSFRTRDGLRLRYATAASRQPFTRGTVILLQGRNEAIEKYFETIGDLTEMGFAVATFDWRGQGGSDRLLRDRFKGHVKSFDDYARDLDQFVREIVVPASRPPYVILAHSTGGLIALAAAPRLSDLVERMVLSAPLIALANGRAAMGLLGVAMSLLGAFGLGRRSARPLAAKAPLPSLSGNLMTSDRRRFERNRRLAEAAPWLFLRGPTVAWLKAAIAAMRRLDDSDVIAELRVPTLFVTAGADRVVDSAEAERLAWRMRSGHLLTIPGSRHEILQEADRYRGPFLAAFESFAGHLRPPE